MTKEAISRLHNQPVAVIFFSNPSDSNRLRLDIEHRYIDELLDKMRLEPTTIKRVQATSIEDIVDVLRDTSCKVVQFSSHGTQDAILLEDASHGSSQLISASQIASLLTEIAPEITAAIFMSCFSTESIPELIRVAPYLITVTGPASDRAAITFITDFYSLFLETNSIERAFSMAQLRNSVASKESQLNAVLSRRAIEQLPKHALFQVFPGNGLDSILVDLSKVEREIESLDIGKDRFLTLLSRKIRIHRWIFSTPRERTLLSIGSYFGVFSWKDVNDVVTCDQLLRLRSDVDEEVCNVWASLIVTYNDHYVDRYRLTPMDRDHPNLPRLLNRAVNDHHITYETFFEGKYSHALQCAVPEQYKATKALANANLRMCDIKLHEEDYPSTVAYLESTLSAIHDLVDALTEALTV